MQAAGRHQTPLRRRHRRRPVEGTGAARKVVNRTPEELEKLRRIVASAVGIQTGADNTRGDQITLEEMPFNDQFATDVTQRT